jgi:hypothetical protein
MSSRRLALAVALLAPAAAHAQLELGARIGWAVPAGHAYSGSNLAALVNGALPLQLDVGYRLTPALSVGAYASWALARVDAHVTEAAGVKGASVLRAGLRVSYALLDLSPTLVPWAGLGAGYQRLNLDAASDFTYTGWDVALVEMGADWKVSPSLRAGPFVSWSLGRYLNLNGGDLSPKGGHAWVTLGLRGTYGL